MSVKSKVILAVIGLTAMQPAFAATKAVKAPAAKRPAVKVQKESAPLLTDASAILATNTRGGLSHGIPGKDPYWFAISGALQADAVGFFGKNSDKGTQFRNSSTIRRAGFGLSGGVGPDWSYTLVIDVAQSRAFNLSDAYGSYNGIKNAQINVGQINPSFALDNTFSSKWIPFMERSLASDAFSLLPGIGVQARYWGEHYSVDASITTPVKGAVANISPTASGSDAKSDQPLYSARMTWAPINAEGRVAQIGVAGYYQRIRDYYIEFSTSPEIRARAASDVVNTTGTAGKSIQAKNKAVFTLDLAAQQGPLYGEAVYQQANIHRTSATSLRFKGYHALAAYVLTGEHRSYDVKSGTFGAIKPHADGTLGAV